MTVQSLKGKRAPILAADVEAAFWSRVDRSGGPDACWPWLRTIEPDGYGQLHWQAIGGHRRAHVVAYELSYGEIPLDPILKRKLDVDHKCHNLDLACDGGPACLHRRCCNPAHLVVKTTIVNKDSADHPRKRGLFREKCGHGHAFSEDNVLWAIRTKPRSGKQRVRVPERRCRRCEYTKMCKNPDCGDSLHDHAGTPWPPGNYALILAARVSRAKSG